MKFLICLCLVTAVLALEDPLKEVLKSPQATLNLYRKFKDDEHLEYHGVEDRMRFRLFRKSAEFVAEENSRDGSSATLGLNLFSTMTRDERQRYLGLNITGHHANSVGVLELSDSTLSKVPAEKHWINEGMVTEVKNQGACGSCWTFGAVGGLESRYADVAKVLRAFSEQEYLDCVYEGDGHDGCNGGWPKDCYTYSVSNGGRLASAAAYPYAMVDGVCNRDVADGMIAARIVGYKAVKATEAANVAAIAKGSLAVAFEVTDYMMGYQKGILKDVTCSGWPNHAVTAVGYTPQYVLVKNSWGTGWGESGYVKFARGHHNCDLFKYSGYPLLRVTGTADTGAADAATAYVPNDDVTPNPEPTCVDWYHSCEQLHCQYEEIAKEYCAKTCKRCDGQGGECPAGTIKCPDGVCRHEHMC